MMALPMPCKTSFLSEASTRTDCVGTFKGETSNSDS